MPKLLIENNYPAHFEIIESCILKYHSFFNLKKETSMKIYLVYQRENPTFKKYLINRYQGLNFSKIEDYDYYINCTNYDRNYDMIVENNKKNKIFICHEITERLAKQSNVWFLTELARNFGSNNILQATALPYKNIKIKSNIPIFIVQGALYNNSRRDHTLLKKILQNGYEYDFQIKVIGNGKIYNYLSRLKDTYRNKLVIKNNLNFCDYHREFRNGYCILPLISKKKQPQYYTNKITSSINYIRAYKLKSIIDKDLQDIYNLEDAYVYDTEDNIIDCFKKALENFYLTD